MGSVLMLTGRVVTAGVDDTCRSALPGWGPCKREAEEPQPAGMEVEDDVGAARGDCTGTVGGVAVQLVTGDGRPGNRASPGVEDLCGVGMAEGV